MHSFIWFNKPFTKKFYLSVCFVIRHCCRCNTIYSSQYDQCRQNIVTLIFFSLSRSLLFRLSICSFLSCFFLYVCCSFCFVKYEYWQTTFLYNRAHRRKIKQKKEEKKSTTAYLREKVYARKAYTQIASHRPYQFFFSPSQFSQHFWFISANDEKFKCNILIRMSSMWPVALCVYTQLNGATNLLTFATNISLCVWCFIFSWLFPSNNQTRNGIDLRYAWQIWMKVKTSWTKFLKQIHWNLLFSGMLVEQMPFLSLCAMVKKIQQQQITLAQRQIYKEFFLISDNLCKQKILL